MSHKDLLQRLTPLTLGGVFGADLIVEGNALDLVQVDIEAQRQTIITDVATILPASNDLIKIIPVKWDIKKPFYIMLAASAGYTIRIDDNIPSMTDWMCIDDCILEEPREDFSAGLSLAGDYLSQENVVTPWIWEVVVITSPLSPPVPSLEEFMNDLKPAHMQLNFTYL
jgi:hypothetical protein